MGAWPEPVLAYGYYLGGRDPGWSILPVNDDSWGFDPTDLDWFEGDESDFIYEAEIRLNEVLGENHGVEFIMVGAEGGFGRILGFEHDPVVDGELVVPDDLVVLEWNKKLAAALEVLGIAPEQHKPYWLSDACHC